jgi:three-Cys-motif partner protein
LFRGGTNHPISTRPKPEPAAACESSVSSQTLEFGRQCSPVSLVEAQHLKDTIEKNVFGQRHKSLVVVSPESSLQNEVVAVTQPESPILGSDGKPARATGPWVREKKYYFERYLSIFTKGVSRKWNGKLSYIDLFAGPGRSVVRNTGEEVEGSPLIALKCNFARYLFVDNPDVLRTLSSRIENHPKRGQVTLIEGDCNAAIESIRAAAPPDHLTLTFIDPTGLQIHFDTIQRLVQDRKVDLLMTIQLGMGITMNLKQYSQSQGDALNSFLGNSTWREDVEKGGTPSQIGHRIVDRYMRQLRVLGYETVENRDIPVRTDLNKLLLYFIVLATRHPRGQDFWRKSTQIQPSGQRHLDF